MSNVRNRGCPGPVWGAASSAGKLSVPVKQEFFTGVAKLVPTSLLSYKDTPARCLWLARGNIQRKAYSML